MSVPISKLIMRPTMEIRTTERRMKKLNKKSSLRRKKKSINLNLKRSTLFQKVIYPQLLETTTSLLQQLLRDSVERQLKTERSPKPRKSKLT
jgi:hypothetical protein